MKLGIIGQTGAGKTTVFEALTNAQGDSHQHRESRIATVKVPDERVNFLSSMYQPRKTIFAQVEYFLPSVAENARDQSIWTQARDCDALIHVVRNFQSYGIDPPDARNDILTIDQELIISDLMVTEKRLERLALDQKRGKKPNPEEAALLEQCAVHLNAEIPLRRFPELATARILRGYAFLSAKPMLVLFNNDDDTPTIPDNISLDAMDLSLAMRGKLEQELASMAPEEAQVFLKEFGIQDLAMDRVIATSYELMGLVSFFTVGEDEVKAWTIQKETAAVDAAEVIHSDIKKGFIRAEVLAYTDLVTAGSFTAARKLGTVRLEGKTYLVQNGDIITFRFNV